MYERINVDYSHIGKTLYPVDNSYTLLIEGVGETNPLLAGTSRPYDTAKPVKVVSGPYTRKYEFNGREYTNKFVTVLYQGCLYSVLNIFTIIPDEIDDCNETY